MNIEKLISAAKEIDRLAELQEGRVRDLQDAAARAREATPEELKRIQAESSRGLAVTDFGGAINAIRKALRAKA